MPIKGSGSRRSGSRRSSKSRGSRGGSGLSGNSPKIFKPCESMLFVIAFVSGVIMFDKIPELEEQPFQVIPSSTLDLSFLNAQTTLQVKHLNDSAPSSTFWRCSSPPLIKTDCLGRPSMFTYKPKFDDVILPANGALLHQFNFNNGSDAAFWYDQPDSVRTFTARYQSSGRKAVDWGYYEQRCPESSCFQVAEYTDFYYFIWTNDDVISHVISIEYYIFLSRHDLSTCEQLHFDTPKFMINIEHPYSYVLEGGNQLETFTFDPDSFPLRQEDQSCLRDRLRLYLD
ncbi:hypothetical protein GEMRC1_002675 [Eukaryota sp. GEM-RC1]